MQIFFSVGEPSGDLHGANLITELSKRNPSCQFVGYGGPRMAAAGCRLHTDLTELAVMGFVQVFVHLSKFFQLLAEADRYFKTHRPDLVVLIDYPGFNWWIARRAKAQGIPVIYYGTPQIWAWASWRVTKLRRLVDHVLCKLPFEEKWFRDRGCPATYVGHPYFDELRSRELDQGFLDRQATSTGSLVAILPGSRTQEIRSNLPEFLKAARLIRRQVPNVRMAIAVYKQQQVPLVEELVRHSGVVVDVHVGQTAELIHSAKCCLACSGSVSLELLYHGRPSAILYQVSRGGYVLQKLFRKVRYITLVNLLTAEDPFAGRSAGVYDARDPRDQHVLMPEYLTYEDCSAKLAEHVVSWLKDEAIYVRTQRALWELRDRVAQGGASQRAAEYITLVLQRGPASTVAARHGATRREEAA